MTKRSWIRQLFTRPVTRTIRNAPRRMRLDMEALEARDCPSTFTVTNTLADYTVGSLPWAVDQVDANAGANTINFDPTVFSTAKTITLGQSVRLGELDLYNTTGTITITGPAAGVTISGGGMDRVFQVEGGVTANFSGLTITGGVGILDESNNEAGGGLFNNGTANLTNCTLSGNTAQGANARYFSAYAGAGRGGAIFNNANLTLTNCTLSGNMAQGGAGYALFPSPSHQFHGGLGQGGAIYNNVGGNLTLTNCTVSGNTAQGGLGGYGSSSTDGGVAQGGAVFSVSTLALTGCTLSGNKAQGGIGGRGGDHYSSITNVPGGKGGSGQGGAIYNNSTLSLTTCTVSGNTAQGGTGGYGSFNSAFFGSAGGSGGSGQGGAIFNNATLALTNCTVNGNAGAGGTGGRGGSPSSISGFGGVGGDGGSGQGGAIFNDSTLTLTNCTVSGNAGAGGPGGAGGIAGYLDFYVQNLPGSSGSVQGAITNQGTSNLRNTIVAGNTGSADPDVYGAVTSQGNNLIGITDGSSGWIATGASADLTGTAAIPLYPLLAPLGNYGGPTQTMALLPGSPAINAGAVGAGIPTTDQRGTPRSGGNDIGAFQSEGFTLTPVAGSTPQTGTYGTFANLLAVTVTANNPLEPVNGGLVSFSVPTTSPSALPISPVTVVGGGAATPVYSNGTPGGPYTVTATTSGSNTVSFNLVNGGPIVVNTVSDQLDPGLGLISLREALAFANSGGIEAITFDPIVFATPQTITLTGGQLTLNDTTGTETITGTAAGVTISGEGLSRVFQVDAGVSASFSALTITGGVNTGLVNLGTTTLIACTFSGNSGGGLVNSGTATLANCTISGNSGGGIGNSGTATLSNCTISGNSGTGLNNSGTATLFNTISDTLSGALTPASSNNLTGSNLLLGLLGNYGGPTQTIPLLPGSPAIDAGSNALASAAGLTADQRGANFPRFINGAVDIGAFESQGFTLQPVAGSTLQTATIGAAFANPLAVSVTANNPLEPVNGGIIKYDFTPAADGASAVFLDPNSATGYFSGLDVQGSVAGGQVSIAAGPNNVAGSYTVVASAAGAIPAVSFTLTNTGPAFTSLVANTTSAALFAGAGLLSLPFAVALANDAGAASTITFDPTVFATPQTIILTGHQLELTDTAGLETITGPSAGVTISGAGLSRVFQVDAGVTSAFSGLIISGGSTASGGGVYNAGALTLTNCTVSGNSARASENAGGGGLLNAGTMTLTNCTISGNTAMAATTAGGGLLNDGTATLTSCTFSGNYSNTSGGGVDNAGTATLIDCTMTANRAKDYDDEIGGFFYDFHFGGGLYNTGTATLINTIAAGNTGGGDVTSAMNFNTGVMGDGNLTAASSNNMIGGNPLLAPLGNYGGPTQTCPLLPGSPAIDAGISSAGIPTTDRRGEPRFGPTDIGACESQGYTLTPVAGSTPQTSTFGVFKPLAVTVTPTYALDPVNGGIVHFTVPTSGPSVLLSSTVTIAGGVASTSATVNGVIGGPYTVTASTRDSNTVSFTLTNGESGSLAVNTVVDVVNSTDSKTSLREAIAYAKFLGGNQTVTFDPTIFNSPQTILLTLGQIDLTDASCVITIQGLGVDLVSISGDNASRVFTLFGGSANLRGVTVTGGSSAGNGGALYDNSGTLTLTNCTVSGSSAANGGGLYDKSGTLILTNCTISGDSATSSGGGLVNDGTATLINCTVSANSAGMGGGLVNSATATLTLGNTIVAGNTAGVGPDVSGAVTSLGNNLIGKIDGSSGWVAADQTGTIAAPLDAQLQPLDVWQTMLPLSTSPALDHGNNSLIPAGISTDERGLPRISNGTVDIGAVEGDYNPSFVVNTTSDEFNLANNLTSLREAIYFANFMPNRTITFDPTVFASAQTITLGGSQLELSDRVGTMSITGPAAGVTINGAGLSRVLEIDGGVNATFSGLTISGGSVGGGGGGLWNLGTATLTYCTIINNSTSGNGGDLLNQGTLNLTNCTVSGGMARAGGGLSNNGTATLTNCTVTADTAQNGSGKSQGGGIFNAARLTLNDCTLSGNTAEGGQTGDQGGAIYNSGSTGAYLSLTNCTLAANIAGKLGTVSGSGGAVFNKSANAFSSALMVKMTNCTVSGNTATFKGGGLYNYDSFWISEGSRVDQITSSADPNPSFELANTIVAGNITPGIALYPDAYGPFVSLGHNLIGNINLNSGTETAGVWLSSDLIDVKPLLGPLGNYGGPTETMPLLEGSPALNAGASGPGIPTMDQRGLPRSGAPDIGAFELQPNDGYSYVVNTTSDALNPGPGLMSLREAVTLASANVLPTTITFDPTIFATHQTITETDLLQLNVSSAGTDYFYQVVAVMANSGQVASLEVGAATPTVTLNWSAVAGATAYNIYRRTSGGGYVFLDTVSGQTTFQDSGASSTTTAIFHAWLELSDTTAPETITGPAAGVTIDGGDLGQVFQIDAGVTASISGMTITGATIAADIPVTLVTGALTINQNAALTLDQCTISSNTGTGVLDLGTVTLTNCTISGNTAQVGAGGMRVNGNTAVVTLTNCTISGNTGKGTGGIAAQQGGSVTLVNTIVAGNTGTNPDVVGTFNSLGNNLIGIIGSSTGWVTSDLTGTSTAPLDPKLGPLADNGGPTETMALLPGSPAIDAGNNANAVDANGNPLTTDQRGDSRIVNGTVDIGAYEFGAEQSQTITFGALADATFGDADFVISATATSGLPVSFTASGDACVREDAGQWFVHIIGAGSATITAQQAGDATFAAAADVDQVLTINKAATITTTFGAGPFTYDGSAQIGGSGTVSGAGGLDASTTVTYSANADGTGVADEIDAGTYYVTAHFAGDDNYLPSDGNAIAIVINKAPTTTTTFGAGPFTYDGDSQTGGSGTVIGPNGFTADATLTYSANADGTASADMIDAGTYYVTAHFAGNMNHEASDGLTVAIVINKAPTMTTTFGAGPFTYNGDSQTGGSGTVTGPNGFTADATLTYSANADGTGSADMIDAGTYYVTAHFAGNMNHEASDGLTVAIVINQAPTMTTTFGAGPFTYNGDSQTGGSGMVIGPNGFTADATLTYSANADGTGSADTTDAGTYFVTAHYAGDMNHEPSDGLTIAIVINQAPTMTTTFGAGPFTYNGGSQAGGSGTVIGPDSFSACATLTYSANADGTGSADTTDAGTYFVTAHFAGDINHKASDGAAVAIVINKASSMTTTIGAGPLTYTGSAQPAGSGMVTGPGIITGSVTVTYSANANGTGSADQTDAGTYYVTAHYAGDANHTGSDGSAVAITINKAASTTTVTIGAGPFVFTGSPITPATVSVTGAGGLNLTPTANYANNINPGVATASYSFAGDANHLPSSNSKTFIIGATTPIVSSPTATSITSTIATLGGNVTSNGGANLIKRGILYAPSAAHANLTIGSPGVTEVDATSVATGVLTQNITGLTPNKSYSFVAFATNGQELTGYSPTSSFSTTILGPLSVITGPTSGRPGQSLSFVLNAYDPIAGMQLYYFTFHINWGDGKITTATALNGATSNHTYASAGTYVIQISATDGDSNTLPTGTLTVTISSNPAGVPSVVIGSTNGQSKPAAAADLLVVVASGASSKNAPASPALSSFVSSQDEVGTTSPNVLIQATNATATNMAVLDIVLAEWCADNEAATQFSDGLGIGSPNYALGADNPFLGN